MKNKIAFAALIMFAISIIGCSDDNTSSPPPPDLVTPQPPEVVDPLPGTPGTGTPAPSTFTGFYPKNAFLGDTITITGTNIEANRANLQLKFGNVETTIVSATPTTAKVIVPNDLNEAEVKIVYTSGNTSITSSDSFHLNAPVINSISYTKGFAGQFINIYGKGFRNSFHIDQISFNGIVIQASLTNVGNKELFLSVPKDTPKGSYPISVTIAGMTVKAPSLFEVVVPTITSMTPTAGSKDTTITIKGTNLKDIYGIGISTLVSFKDAETNQGSTAGMVISSEENEIKVKAPKLQSGHTYKVTVLVVKGAVTANEVFKYTEN
ncbi:IPT/TIG domain-containing protein [Flavobacterium sp. HTF]|uniref:IPT/TIG domain-containing protein n=1 Tax=Flavobacterium sp. HTF TaxID=2170732 RepID=UPI000D5C5FD6|nr:IPT/TIG domain-containing protein [Flavobacterium sp. HTF]PWB27219.1 hypothetical protein DCO46_04260 [Flavobacterium sp. HTF]